jgi:hypothetical protein
LNKKLVTYDFFAAGDGDASTQQKKTKQQKNQGKSVKNNRKPSVQTGDL